MFLVLPIFRELAKSLLTVLRQLQNSCEYEIHKRGFAMVQHAEIRPECYYDVDAVRRILGLSVKAIGNACRSGALRFSERGGRRFFRGSWLIAWLEGEHEEAVVAPNGK